MPKIIKIDKFVLVPTNDGITLHFDSAIEKQIFVQSRDMRGYVLHNNYAILNQYMVIDTESSGFCLTPERGVSLDTALFLIQHYL
jgi:hypothetical protein